MTNEQILRIAMEQSAVDLNCSPDDFMSDKNKVVISAENENARKYLKLPFECNLVSYGKNIVASVSANLAEKVEKYISAFSAEHCFETPNLHVLNDFLQAHGLRVCHMAEYFLPDINMLKRHICGYQTRILHQNDFKNLYTGEWGNALCAERSGLDVLGAGAYDGGKLIGLAACSADCDGMRQIGVDVLPEYRRQGVASTLTSMLTKEIFAAGKVPFYCAAWSNIKSVRNALKCGFYPAWVEMTAKTAEYVGVLNKNIIL